MASSEDEPSTRRSGPWVLWMFGVWGTGKHARNDFDIVIRDLSESPDLDEPLPEDQSRASTAFIPAIEESIEPQPGLDVRFHDQIISPGGEDGGPSVWDIA